MVLLIQILYLLAVTFLCFSFVLMCGVAYSQYQVDVQRKSIYWSNCFVEAVRHWMLDPCRVKILYCPASWNETFCPHWMWKDRDGNEYDFNTRDKLKLWQYIWFKGGVRVHRRGTYRRYVDEMVGSKYYGERHGQIVEW